jgi:transposase
MRKKSLYELGVEYEKAAQIVKERIAEKRKQLSALKDPVCSNEAYELKSELNQLYEEHREAMATARHLKHYYDKDNNENYGGNAA